MTQRNISEDRNIQVPFRILSGPQGSPEIDGTVTLRLQQCRVLLQEPDIGSAGGSNRSSHYGCLGAGGGSGSSHHSQWVEFDSDWLSWYRINSANKAVT